MKELLIDGVSVLIICWLIVVAIQWWQHDRTRAKALGALNSKQSQVVRANLVTGGVQQELVCTVTTEVAAIEAVKRCKEKDGSEGHDFYYLPAEEKFKRFVAGC